MLFVIFFLPFVICHLFYVFYFLIIFVLLFVFLALFFCLLFPSTISVTSNKEIVFFLFKPINVSSFKPIKDTFQGKTTNCGQLLLLRITQPPPWWFPFRGNQTLIQMTGSESRLLSFFVNRNVVGKVNKGIPMLPIQSNTIQVNNSSLIFKNTCA